LRLTLLRSPKAPDENADMGEHRFSYSLLPFAGPFGESGIVRSSYELNDSARAEPVRVTADGAEYSLYWTEGESVITETIKAPESGGSRQLVLRLYESLGGPERTILHFNRPLASAVVTDMLEENGREIPLAGDELFLEFRAFEIKTVVVTFK
jgi:alpha-mannosidase